MPFLRVIRDKRGYETTYLMHWYREGARPRSRILYVFRSPGGVRVGRDPLEPEVRRQIEAQHPDIAFDWSVVRDNQQVIEPTPDMRRKRPPRPESDAPKTPGPSAAPPAAVPARPAVPSTIDGATPDAQIAFLSHWYPIVRDAIPQRTTDEARRQALSALAERLNPTSWTDADQMTSGLQDAAEALARLSNVFAKRRRSRRRPSASRGTAPPDTHAPTT